MTRLQQGLTDLFYDPGLIDGLFGAGTQSAVKKFQSDHALEVDGIVGRGTWSALEEAFTMMRNERLSS